VRIAVVSRWNATCGISLHAELLVREWFREGHEVVVFAPTIESASMDWHHRVLERGDEPWVTRCYEECGTNPNCRVDLGGVASRDFDVLLIEVYRRLPLTYLKQLVSVARRKAKVVAVLHEGSKEVVETVVSTGFNAVVVFDGRYVNEVLASHLHKLKGRLAIIPYPCMRTLEVEPKRPPFAEGKQLLFSFGRQPPEEYRDYMVVARELVKRYDLVYWIIRSNSYLKADGSWVKQWLRRPPIEELYSYLKAADIHLLPKGRTKRVVISSTVYQTLGALTPTVVPDVRYVETIPTDERGFGPVVKYRGLDDLRRKVVEIIEDDSLRSMVVSLARDFVNRFRSDKIASKYVELFKEL